MSHQSPATPQGSASPPGTESDALRLLDEEERWARPVFREASVSWWDANLSGRSEDFARMEAAERAINEHYSRSEPFQRISTLIASTNGGGPGGPLLLRRLDRLQRAYRGMQAPRDLLDRITAASTALQEKYGTFRGTFEGRRCSDNDLEEILKTSTDSTRVQAAWEARKQIGAITADDVRRLADLRNEAARAIGFPDFWHQQMILEEIDPDRLRQTLREVDRATEAPFRAMKADLDRALADRFGVDVSALRPWHYGDPFFQETPDAFAPPADPIYAQQDVAELAAQTYRALGFPNIDAILARGDLYPREGKNQHTIYQDGLDRRGLPWDLRDDPQGFLNEGFAMFCERPLYQPAWLSEIAGLPRDEADRLAPRLERQGRSELLAFVRWCLTIVSFERAFYADPAQDLDSLWWDLAERYQHVPRPDGRNAPDWASKVHVATSPVYYHKYLYGRLFSAQLTEHLDQRFGGWWSGRPASGQFIKAELFAPGATYPWPTLVQRVTGHPLGVQALARAVAWT